MSKLSAWLNHLGTTGQLLNEVGQAVLPTITAEAEIDFENGLNALIAKRVGEVLAPKITPTADELFTGILSAAGVPVAEPASPPAA